MKLNKMATAEIKNRIEKLEKVDEGKHTSLENKKTWERLPKGDERSSAYYRHLAIELGKR